MMSAIKTRFGYHPNQQPDAAETAPPPVKSSSSPDLLLKSASRDTFLLQSSSYKDKSSKSDDGEITSSAPSRSFEFREDPNFWKEHSVQVIIRLRPLSNAELSVQGNNRCVRQDSSQAITWAGPPESRFTFDLVADENVTQEMLFKLAGVSLVENCMEGYNSCMFAYGQTGSGKTHTMLGDIEGGTRRHSVNCGMTPRVFEYLFSRIQKDKDARREEKLKFTCKCSFLEIYNEQILDLLDPSSANLQIREDNKKGIYVENITEVEVSSARDVIQQLIQGSANRKVAATNMNRASSRSHSVFTCIIESKWDSQGVTHHRFARLNLVDLAGSERQKSSGAEGERLKEATNINKSLSTLGLVIMNLVSMSNGKSIHVPYRDSKLTFLLQDSLGGNAKTIIIANISPSSSCSLETLSTLKFAQRAKFIKNHAIVNEDASGDVLALRIENQNLKKEVSRLRSLVHGGAESHDADALSISFPGSPGSFKWEGHHGFSSPIISEKRTPHLQKKEYEVALVGILRREKDKDTTLQALVAENQATLQLAKQREDEIQGLKMRLRFREAGIKRLESVASGKISAETHLMKEREEHLKEIEVLRGQVDRNQEVTRFAMENLRLKEEIRRLKSFCEEGERERLNEQIMILQNKLLEALDWKLMHESDPANIQKESHVQSDNDFLISNQASASPWRTSTNEENEFLRMQAIQNQSELDSLHKRLNFIVDEKEKLERHVNDLAKELEAERLSKETMAEEAQKEQAKLTSLINIGQNDQAEIKTMVDAIASASQREAEAHKMAIFLSKENDELRMKLKVLIDDNNKLIDLYESAVAGNRTKISDNSVEEDDLVEEKELETKLDYESQLTEMHEENDKLLSLYEKAMQERDELKKIIASGQRDDKENLVEIDGGECLSFNDASSCFDNKHEIEELDATVPYVQEGDHPEPSSLGGEHLLDETSLYEVHVEDDDFIQSLIDSKTSKMEAHESKEPNEHEESYQSAENTDDPIRESDMSKDLNSIREKLVEAQEKLSHSAQTLSMFSSLERAVIEVDAISDKICKLDQNIQAKQQECENLESISSEMHERKELANRKLSALKNSLTSFSSSANYFEQREAQARSILHGSSKKLSQKKEELNGLNLSRHELTNALSKVKQVENELKNSLESLRSKADEENRKLESERVLVENRNWQVSSKATELLKSEEEKTKLQMELKLKKEKLGDAKKETGALTKKLAKLDSDVNVLEVEIEKETISVEEMNRKVENIVKEKEMLSEVEEIGREEYGMMVVEYYEKMFEAQLKDEEAEFVHEEMLMETIKMEVLQGAKDEAVRRKTALLGSLSCETRFVSDKVVELSSLFELCGSMESQLCV